MNPDATTNEEIDKSKKCAFSSCQRPLDQGIPLINNSENVFKEMLPNENMHIECYISHCISKIINSHLIEQYTCSIDKINLAKSPAGKVEIDKCNSEKTHEFFKFDDNQIEKIGITSQKIIEIISENELRTTEGVFTFLNLACGTMRQAKLSKQMSLKIFEQMFDLIEKELSILEE